MVKASVTIVARDRRSGATWPPPTCCSIAAFSSASVKYRTGSDDRGTGRLTVAATCWLHVLGRLPSFFGALTATSVSPISLRRTAASSRSDRVTAFGQDFSPTWSPIRFLSCESPMKYPKVVATGIGAAASIFCFHLATPEAIAGPAILF